MCMQFSSINYTHTVVKASLPSISRTPVSSQTETLYSLHSNSPPLPSQSSWQPPFYSMFMNVTTHASGTIQCLFFCDWLISPSIMSSRFIYIVACVRILFPLKSWIIFHSMYIAPYVYPLILKWTWVPSPVGNYR